MVLSKSLNKIEGNKIYLRKLRIKDANKNYLSWFYDKTTREYIISAKSTVTIKTLKEYIRTKNASQNSLLLGIFTKLKHKHVGNIKYEPINSQNKSATLGIMIGDKKYRNKGIGSETIKISMDWLNKNYNIKKIKLGVDINNLQAIHLYKKLSFKISSKSNSIIKLEFNF